MVHYISSCRGQIREMPIYLTIDRYVGLIKNLKLRPNAAIVLVSLSAAPFHRCCLRTARMAKDWPAHVLQLQVLRFQVSLKNTFVTNKPNLYG